MKTWILQIFHVACVWYVSIKKISIRWYNKILKFIQEITEQNSVIKMKSNRLKCYFQLIFFWHFVLKNKSSCFLHNSCIAFVLSCKKSFFQSRLLLICLCYNLLICLYFSISIIMEVICSFTLYVLLLSVHVWHQHESVSCVCFHHSCSKWWK